MTPYIQAAILVKFEGLNSSEKSEVVKALTYCKFTPTRPKAISLLEVLKDTIEFPEEWDKF